MAACSRCGGPVPLKKNGQPYARCFECQPCRIGGPPKPRPEHRLEPLRHRQCVQCGAEFSTRISTQTNCSKRCARKGERERAKARGTDRCYVALTCDHCGSEFQGEKQSPGRKGWKRYCSPDCYAKAKHEELAKTCPQHGHLGMVKCPECAEERKQRRQQRADERLPKEILKSDPCSYCGQYETEDDEFSRIGIDHIVPSIAGGDDEWDNWTACCRRCNAQKGTLPLLGYMLWRRVAPQKAAIEAEAKTIQALRP
jgi:hypothetical protein